MHSQIIYTKKLPKLGRFSDETVLLYDSILAKNKDFKNWSKAFSYKIALKSGEGLKTIKSFDFVLNAITKLPVPKSTKLTFLAVGGGSIGDFVGFMASVFLRGRRLILIPSTWLAAVDSSHGGKNGLNFLRTKNQIGSFYPAHKIYICQSLLRSQPEDRLIESLGEIIKIAILGDKKLFFFLESKINGKAGSKNKKINASEIYQILAKVIALKYRIVNQDFFEKKGTRRLLNLGHTMGHVFESHFGWAHGISILLGLQFSARWSLHRGLLNSADFIKISILIESLELKENLNLALKAISKKNKIKKLLSQDKKLVAKEQLEFIFIKKIGLCQRQKIKIEQIIDEVQRQSLEY